MISYVPAMRSWWAAHGERLVLFALVLTAVAAVLRLADALPYLMWTAPDPHPTDLHARHGEVSRWFRGVFYDPNAERADYPPASYVMLWPFLGWLSLDAARWLWGVASVVALLLLGYGMARESGARTRTQQLLLFLLPFSLSATSATMRVGQLGVHVVAALVIGFALLRRGAGRWWLDAAAALLLLFALVKPILSVPLFWVVAFAPGRARPMAIVVLIYAALSLFAASFQDGGLFTVLTGWLHETPGIARGHVNLHRLLALTNRYAWMLPATVVTLLAFGLWVWRRRMGDLWALAGAAAVVARIGFHHRHYDDVLLLIPMLALFRIASVAADGRGDDVVAGILFALLWVTLQLPFRLFGLPRPVPALLELGQAVVWLAVLVFLMRAAREPARSRPLAGAAAG